MKKRSDGTILGKFEYLSKVCFNTEVTEVTEVTEDTETTSREVRK
jgi:hypothetical protein